MSGALGRARPAIATRLAPLLAEAEAALVTGQPDAARKTCRRALKLDPRLMPAWRLLALAELARGSGIEAVAAGRTAVGLAPDEAEGWFVLGLALATDAPGEAADAYRAAIERAPGHAVAHHNLGTLLIAEGDLDGAEHHLVAAIAAQPGAARTRQALGALLIRRGNVEAARENLARAVALDPALSDARRLLGIALVRLGQGEAAVARFRRAVAAQPDDAQAHWQLAECLLALHRHAEALDSLRTVLRLSPEAAGVPHSVGVCLAELDRADEAEGVLRRALAEGPEAPQTWLVLGNVHWRMRRAADALADYQRALALRPDFAGAHFHAALLRLALGDYAEGFREYEWRWRCPPCDATARAFTPPLWLGEPPLAGRTILLHAEQGFGDTLQFARYVPLVAAAGGQVVLEVQPALVGLLAGLPGVSLLVAKGDALPAFDLHCPLLSLPLAFATRLDSVPPCVPLALPVIERRSDGPLRVGVAWAGNPAHADDRRRSIPLALLARLFGLPGIAFTALQAGRRDGDDAVLAAHPEVADAGRDTNFVATAAAIAGLDLVVTVDSAIAHLAGTLGMPVWVLLPHTCDWRWESSDDSTPWYPSARLFRQPAVGDWEAVVEAVAAALVETAVARGETPAT